MGTPRLVSFVVDLTNPQVKAFGKRLAASARTQGGPRYLVYSAPKGSGDATEGKVVHFWFPEGLESVNTLRQGRDPDAANDLLQIARNAGLTSKVAMGKQTMDRIADRRDPTSQPPPAIAVYGVKTAPQAAALSMIASPGAAGSGGSTQNMKAGLKLLHQQVISKNPNVRYAAHKLGDGKHGFLVANIDAPDALKSGSGDHPMLQGDPSADATLVNQLTNLLPGAVNKGATYQTNLAYNAEHSNP